ncbi:hypothetical protein IG631_04498 [Alternaria alternata]|nr:hypothetical protein IG631_04498 [Alternaria alternata]
MLEEGHLVMMSAHRNSLPEQGTKVITAIMVAVRIIDLNGKHKLHAAQKASKRGSLSLMPSRCLLLATLHNLSHVKNTLHAFVSAMRLINCRTFKLEDFVGSDVPKYAILSHTWGREEVLFSDLPLHQASTRTKAGYYKIKCTCEQAVRDGLEFAWVDTCCIDKSSSAELSEAINSMFRWYLASSKCYAFLEDVSAMNFENSFPESRWFTRGWTLQELIAPPNVVFYDKSWEMVGSRRKLAHQISKITRVDSEVLGNGIIQSPWMNTLDDFCVAKKMSWASYRETTRQEDQAYCLMGLFNINMPLLYGEGNKAYVRLQEEIIKKNNDDDSILAWGLDTREPISSVDKITPEYRPPTLVGEMLAKSPLDFRNCVNLARAPVPDPLLTLDNVGINIRLPLVLMHISTVATTAEKLWIGLLSCSLQANKSSCILGILLSPKDWRVQQTSPRYMVRRWVSEHKEYSRTVLVTTRDALQSTDFQDIIIVTNIRQSPTGANLYNETYLIDETRKFSAEGLRFLNATGWHGTDYPQSGGRMLRSRGTQNWQAGSRTYTRLCQDQPIRALSLAFSSRNTHPMIAFVVHIEMSLNLAMVCHSSSEYADNEMHRVWNTLRDRVWQTNSDRMTYTEDDGRRIEISISLKEKRTIHHWKIFGIEIDVVSKSSLGSSDGEDLMDV